MKYQINKGIKSFGGTTILDSIQFEIRNTEKIAIVGRNGCGKTTLLKAIAEVETLDGGDIHKETGLRIGYLAQTTFENEQSCVLEELEHAFNDIKELQKQLDVLTETMTYDHSETILNRYARLQQRFEEMGGYTYHSELMTIFTKFGFEEEDLKREVSTFSGGQKTRLAFVKLLLSKPDVLLLDEPTNHLDIDTIEWLENYVKRYPKAVVLVSHDRMFLDDVVDVVYEIEYGVMRRYPGNYSHYVATKKSDVEQQRSAYIRQQKEIQHMEELIEKFRYKKNKAAFAQSKLKYLDRMDRIDDPKTNEATFHAQFEPNVRGGKRVLEIQELVIGYQKEEPLANLSLDILQGQRVAVIGPNGKGKSTLLKTIMRQVPALSGNFLLGHQIEPGYFDQELAQFDSNKTVIEEVWDDFPNLTQTEVRTALGCFLFHGDDAFKTVDCLSGGEKVRLSFVKLMLLHPNFLIMDEPTNHLDLVGKEALEDSLIDYTGTMLFVSHDRYFISKLATAIVVIDEGKATYYPLTYTEYSLRNTIEQPITKEVHKPVATTIVKAVNYQREVKKLEKKIEDKEEELESLRALRFEPEYYHDYQKMNTLDARIDDIHNQIETMMKQWEDYSEKLEQ